MFGKKPEIPNQYPTKEKVGGGLELDRDVAIESVKNLWQQVKNIGEKLSKEGWSDKVQESFIIDLSSVRNGLQRELRELTAPYKGKLIREYKRAFDAGDRKKQELISNGIVKLLKETAVRYETGAYFEDEEFSAERLQILLNLWAKGLVYFAWTEEHVEDGTTKGVPVKMEDYLTTFDQKEYQHDILRFLTAEGESCNMAVKTDGHLSCLRCNPDYFEKDKNGEVHKAVKKAYPNTGQTSKEN